MKLLVQDEEFENFDQVVEASQSFGAESGRKTVLRSTFDDGSWIEYEVDDIRDRHLIPFIHEQLHAHGSSLPERARYGGFTDEGGE